MQTFQEPQVKREKILVAVKTYTQVSIKYTETVCTAGLLENGKWIRIYPVPYRAMGSDKKFKKYQWIEADIIKDKKDPRPESYKLAGDIELQDIVDTKDAWEERKKIVLSKVYNNLDTLIHEARDTKTFTSLATFKPKRIIGFSVEKKPHVKNKCVNLIEAIPFKFYYKFVDRCGKRSKLQILDWELYQLCRKLIRLHGKNTRKIASVLREKYLHNMSKKDVYLLLGTNKYWHIRRSKNPFMIIGVFYPPK